MRRKDSLDRLRNETHICWIFKVFLLLFLLRSRLLLFLKELFLDFFFFEKKNIKKTRKANEEIFLHLKVNE